MTKPELAVAVCREGWPVDPDFPQLKIASDPGLMLEVFRSHLKPVAGKAYHIAGCIPCRFRCRQSTTRCVLQYILRLVEPSTGRQLNQWVTGLVYARLGEAEQLWHEIQADEPRRDIPDPWLTFEPVAFIADLEMVVVVFPYDRRLPNLGPVMNGGVHRLDPLLLARLEPGEWVAEERTIEPTRYRTELGAALRYTLRARDTQSARNAMLRCYLKVYRNTSGEETFRLLQSLGERTVNERRGWYSVVKPIAYLSELRTLALEEAAGSSLQQLLLEGRDPAALARPIARAVAALNQDDLGVTRRQALAGQLKDLQLASTLVQWACPQMREEVSAIAAAVGGGLEDVPLAPIHGDLKADHLFLYDDHVIFIDLDSVVLGDPVRDPAHLFAYLTGRVGLDALPPERARAAAATFVDEYFRRVPTTWRARFALHCAGALIEVASGIFRRQEPQWPEKVTATVKEAQRALSEGVL